MNEPRDPRKPPRTYSTEWTPQKAARLALLIAWGLSAREIAAEPEFDTTENNIWRQASRLGLSFREHPVLNLSFKTHSNLQAAASVRGILPNMLISRILNTLAHTPSLLDNVLDDGHHHPYGYMTGVVPDPADRTNDE